MTTPGARHITVSDSDAGRRLDTFLRAQAPGAPTALIHKWLRTGQVRLDGKRAKGDARLAAGQDVRLPPFAPAPEPSKPRGISERDAAFARRLVLWSDDAALAIAKPPGLVTQGGRGVARHLADLLPAFGDGVRLVHRLDKSTSGALLLARGAAAATALGAAFKAGRVRKLYWALVPPAPADEAWSATAPLAKGGGEGREKMRPTPVREGGQRARTDFRVLARLGPGVALVACAPRTGRTHQIRAHLALSACPILGDGKYGGARAIPGAEAALPREGIALHARRIAAPHPVPGRQAIDVTAPPPRALGALLTALGLMPEGADGDAFLDYS